ncbi:MAG: hypothetical protein NTV30_10640 [Chloroflexi bacterium]|nr:hypothetical protein [Chloroflexota bacterium]
MSNFIGGKVFQKAKAALIKKPDLKEKDRTITGPTIDKDNNNELIEQPAKKASYDLNKIVEITSKDMISVAELTDDKKTDEQKNDVLPLHDTKSGMGIPVNSNNSKSDSKDQAVEIFSKETEVKQEKKTEVKATTADSLMNLFTEDIADDNNVHGFASALSEININYLVKEANEVIKLARKN